MASLIRRKNKSVWVAQIKFQGKTIQRSTGIPIAADADPSERLVGTAAIECTTGKRMEQGGYDADGILYRASEFGKVVG